MAKKNGAMQGVSPVPSGQEPRPPQGGSGVAPASAVRCRCGGTMNRGTLPDGTAAFARISLVPETLPQGLYNFGPVLDAAMLICTTCQRVELVWSGR